MNTAERDAGPVKTSKTVFRVIEGVEDLGEVRASELAEHLDLSLSTVHDHLTTLVELGYLIREDKSYRIGLKFLRLGVSAQQLVQVDPVRARLDEIAEHTGETAWFVVEEDGLAVHVDRALGEHGIRTANRIGRRSHLHFHAGGKAILAHLPEGRIDEIVERRGLPASTEHTITTEAALLEELETVRERGVALNDNEEILGTRSVAAPIQVDQEVVGAISVGGPANRLDGSRFRSELPELVTGMVNEIELQLQYGQEF